MKRSFIFMVMAAILVTGLCKADITLAAPRTELPEPKHKGDISVEEAIYKRVSTRRYSRQPLSLEEVSQILWAAGGVTVDGVTGPTRSYASAGGRYPLEIYLVAGNVTGLTPGVYRYKWRENTLEFIKKGDMREQLSGASYRQRMVADAPATVVVTTTEERARERYGDIGAGMFLYMDAGHLGENVHLQAEAMGLGTCMIGAYTAKDVTALIGVPGEETVYIMPIGKPAK